MQEPIACVRLTRAWLAEGVDSSDLARRVRRGEIVRLRRGAYADQLDPEVRRRHRQLIAATLPIVGPNAVLSHESAAVLHGLPTWPDTLRRVHATHRQRDSGGHRRTQWHLHPGPLADTDVVVLEQWAVTSLARTVADLGRTAALERAVAFADAAFRLGLPRWQLDREVERAGGRHGIGRLRFVASFADARAESVGESRSRLLLHQVGLPPPIPQYKITDPATGLLIARSDFGWEEQRTLGEYDGRIKYGELLQPGQFAGDVVYDEKLREDLLRDLGHEMARWTTPDLLTPPVIRDRVLRAFARSARRR